MAFATISEYYNFTGECEPEPGDVDPDDERKMLAGLERSTDAVRGMLQHARYPRARDGLPRSTAQRTAIVRATCAQFAWIKDRDDDFSGAGNEWDSVSLMDVSFSKRAGSAASTMSPSESLYSPEAFRILKNAGFFTTRTRHAGRVR